MSSSNSVVPAARCRGGRAGAYPILKRATDIVLALLILVAIGPLILLSAAVVKLTSPGSAFIRVPRIGLGGRTILVRKLRTMHTDSDRLLEEHLRTNREAADQWYKYYKLVDDPRIIAYVGNFLRKFSIDELPQLIDVLTGQMSLVGPRPLPEYHLRALDLSFCEFRSSVMPGLTGLWQIECRSAGDLDDLLYWDEKYIEKRSYLFDLGIILRTPLVVLSGRAAY